jgi:hypothetical protein
METIFYILLNIQTPEGLENFCKFSLGNDSDFAYALFSKLQGTSEVSENNILYLELIETKAGLPLNLKIMTCTLDEISENCRLITKETFRRFSLDPDPGP